MGRHDGTVEESDHSRRHVIRVHGGGVMTRRLTPFVAIGSCCLLVIAGCERESKSFHEREVAAARTDLPGQTQLAAGGASPATGTASPFQANAWGIAEGKRLFSQYNCSGCHAHGGGGIGPALMDDQWIYGYEAHTIFETIVEGRPD